MSPEFLPKLEILPRKSNFDQNFTHFTRIYLKFPYQKRSIHEHGWNVKELVERDVVILPGIHVLAKRNSFVVFDLDNSCPHDGSVCPRPLGANQHVLAYRIARDRKVDTI